MAYEQGLEVSCCTTIFDHREELELGLHATGREDDQGLASVLPGFQSWNDIFKERGLELAVIIAGLP